MSDDSEYDLNLNFDLDIETSSDDSEEFEIWKNYSQNYWEDLL